MCNRAPRVHVLPCNLDSPLKRLMAHLVLTNDPEVGKSYSLDKGEVTIGRHPDCEIAVMDSGRVSRRHAKIICERNSYRLKDMGIRNGTFLNGRRVGNELTRLKDGDCLRICDLEFVFHGDPAPKETKSQTKGTVGLSDPPGENSSMEAVLVDDEATADSSSTILSKLDVRSSAEGGFQMTASLEARLEALIEITRNLGKALNLDQVLPQVLNSLFKNRKKSAKTCWNKLFQKPECPTSRLRQQINVHFLNSLFK